MGLNLGGFGGKLQNFVDNYGTLVGAAGQLASTESAVKKLEGLGKDAVEDIGFPAGSIYDTVRSDTTFKPFGVTGLPTGTISTDAMGGTQYSLSPEQQALATSLRTGGSSLVDAVLGRGQYGTFNPETGLMQDDMRAGQQDLMNLLQMTDKDDQGRTYRGLKQEQYGDWYVNPFLGDNIQSAEQAAYDRLRAIRTPEEQRAQTALNQNLVAQGRQGLQTAEFGGSPEQFALSKAIEEQKSVDALAAMGMAREDAQRIADQRGKAVFDAREDQKLGSIQRLAALQQQATEKGLGADIASSFLAQSYAPQTQLLQSLTPSIQLSDIATAAGRDMGNYGTNLANTMLNYDLGTRGAAAALRNQTMQGLFDLLISDKTAQGNVAAAQAGGAGGNNIFDIVGGIQKIASQGNPNYDANNPSTWYVGGAPNWYNT